MLLNSKKYICFCLLFLFVVTINDAQETLKKRAFCENILTGEEVAAQVTLFKEQIYWAQFDTLSTRIFIEFRDFKKLSSEYKDKGDLAYFDLERNKIIWSKSINYLKEEVEYFGEHAVMRILRNGNSYLVDGKTGIPNKKLKYSLFHVTKNNIGLGFLPGKNDNLNIIGGIDLETNEAIWERDISPSYGISELKYLNDSILLLAAYGLHSVNLKNGRGWSFKLQTGEVFSKGNIPGYVAGFLVNGMMGVFNKGARDVNRYNRIKLEYSGALSNILSDDTGVYLAGKKAILKTDSDGKIIHEFSIPGKNGSNSRLLRKGDNLILVNSGKAQYYEETVYYGRPLIVAYDIDTGKRNFLRYFGERGKNIIYNVKERENNLIVITQRNVFNISYIDGTVLSEVSVADSRKKEYLMFLNDDVYIQTEDFIFVNANSHYNNTTNLLLKNRKKKKEPITFIRLDNGLKIIEKRAIEDYWKHFTNYKSLQLVSNENQILILNKEGVKLSSFIKGNDVKIIGSSLYIVKEKSLLTVDLNQFE